MNLVAYDKKKLDNLAGYRTTKLHSIIEEFAASDMDCAKVENWTHKTASSCQSALTIALKRYNKSGIRCMVRNGEVYLIKETTK